MKNIIFNYEKDLEIINWLKALDIRGRLNEAEKSSTKMRGEWRV